MNSADVLPELTPVAHREQTNEAFAHRRVFGRKTGASKHLFGELVDSGFCGDWELHEVFFGVASVTSGSCSGSGLASTISGFTAGSGVLANFVCFGRNPAKEYFLIK